MIHFLCDLSSTSIVIHSFSTLNVADLENLDTCDYVDSVKYEHQDNLIVMQLNIRGLYSKISLLTNLLSSCVDGRLPDVALLSETWLTPASPPVNIPGYDLVHYCRPNKRGGGVGILVSNKHRYTKCDTIISRMVKLLK